VIALAPFLSKRFHETVGCVRLSVRGSSHPFTAMEEREQSVEHVHTGAFFTATLMMIVHCMQQQQQALQRVTTSVTSVALSFFFQLGAKTLGKSVLIKKRTFDQIRGALLIKFGI
jgi:hypothetical protein